MIPALFMMWCLAAPMGFLVGDVFAHRNLLPDDVAKVLPYLCAVFTPLGAIVALVLIVQTETVERDEDV